MESWQSCNKVTPACLFKKNRRKVERENSDQIALPRDTAHPSPIAVLGAHTACRIGLPIVFSTSFELRLSVDIVVVCWDWDCRAVILLSSAVLDSMRRLVNARLPVLNARFLQPPLCPSSTATAFTATTAATATRTASTTTAATTARPTTRTNLALRRSSPLSQTSKRLCSYRRMCGSRRADGGSTVVPHGRDVLPSNVSPVHYDLTLDPDFEKFTYDGSVVIEYVFCLIPVVAT